jgi:hypothetical protein
MKSSLMDHFSTQAPQTIFVTRRRCFTRGKRFHVAKSELFLLSRKGGDET